MLTLDRLVILDAHLDRARLQFDRLESPLSRVAESSGTAVELRPVQRLLLVSAGLERARVYLRAAHETTRDVADDMTHGSTSRVAEDLRLVKRLCAMVDELSGQAARQLAAMTRDPSAADERGRDLTTALSWIDQARSGAQAAGRVADELAADQRSPGSHEKEPAAQRLRAEQQGRRPRGVPTGVIGVPR